MKVDIIYIACYRRDYRLTRALVASIRRWYPDLPIELLKDENMMAFDTSRLERLYNVGVYPSRERVFGMGFFKLEPLFREDGKRMLLLDSDVIMTGPVLEVLEPYDEDFLIVREEDTDDNRNRYYFNLDDVRAWDPSFRYPGFTFNTGQLVATGGVLKRSDFDGLMEWSTPRKVLRRDVFKYHGEQPVLNYAVLKKFSDGQATLKRVDFMRESKHPDTTAVSLDRILEGDGYPFIIHWHDGKPKVNRPSLNLLARNDLVRCFETMYYRKAGIGRGGQFIRLWAYYLVDEMFLFGLGVLDTLRKLKRVARPRSG